MFACSFSPSLTQGRLLRRGKAAKAAPNAPLRDLRLEPFAMLPHVLEARRIVGRYEREPFERCGRQGLFGGEMDPRRRRRRRSLYSQLAPRDLQGAAC